MNDDIEIASKTRLEEFELNGLRYVKRKDEDGHLVFRKGKADQWNDVDISFSEYEKAKAEAERMCGDLIRKN